MKSLKHISKYFSFIYRITGTVVKNMSEPLRFEGLKLDLFTKDELYEIHLATLDILEGVGVGIYEPRALKLMDEAGAIVDYDKKVVRIPQYLLKELIKKAPEVVTLCARNSKHTVRLKPWGKTYFNNSSYGVRVYDLKTGMHRDSRSEDVVNFAKLTDALENIHVYLPTVTAHDIPEYVRALHELAISLDNTEKHVSHGASGADAIKRYVQIGATIVGGEEELRKRPVISASTCPISPLQHSQEDTETLIEFAKFGLPFFILSMAMGGGTAPLTIAGELVVINAEVLSGIALVQLVNPGTPVLYGSVSSTMDMKTGKLALGAPERPLINSGCAQLARYYGIPSWVGACSTDAKAPGPQAMFEKVMTAIVPMLAGASLIYGPAILDSGKTYSFEQLVLDNEVIGALYRIVEGVDVDADSLALEVIENVGIGGHYLAQKHTSDHVLSDQWRPALLDRGSRGDWIRASRKDICELARERAKELLASHEVEPLEKDVRKEMWGIVKKAERELKRTKQ